MKKFTWVAGDGGEGTEWIILFLIVMIVIVVSIVAWKLIQKKRSMYTYKYSRK